MKPFLSRRRGTGPSMTATTPGLIGGISGTETERYTSVASAASRREPTTRDQLTMNRQTQGCRHVTDPAQAPSSRNTSAGPSYQGSVSSGGMGGEGFVNENIVDYNSGFPEDKNVSRHSDLPLLGQGAAADEVFHLWLGGWSDGQSVLRQPSMSRRRILRTLVALSGYTGYRRRAQDL